MENFIQLNKSDVLTLKIKTADGKETGEQIVIDLEDIELPLIYQEMIEKLKKNKEYLRNQILIISKRQDVKGKKLLSKNEEDKIKALNDFFHKQVETYNMFLGENGVEKILNGRKIGWTTFNEIDNIIEKQITPYLDISKDKITKKIKDIYGVKKEENEVLE